MRTNSRQRKYGFRLLGTMALAGCLGIPAASVAFAQDTGQQAANSDSAIQSAVASAIAHDPALQNQQIKAYTSNGVVTLTGTVQNEQQRQEAETIAAGVQGVSGIQNSLNVTETGGQAQAPPPPPENPQSQGSEQAPPPPPPDTQQPAAPAATQQMPPPPPPDQSTSRAPYPGYGSYPPPQGYGNYPPQQTSGPVTVPAGTLLQIRTSQPLDPSKLQDGAVFDATAASDVFEGNVLAIPRGAQIEGTVIHVKKPGPLGGSGELQLQIKSVSLGGRAYPVTTDIWSNRSPNKAGYTASNTAGGALVGALIGGLLGRGPGAAAGAIVGGGAGLAASAATNGPREYLPAETLLNFHLATPVAVQPVSWQEAQRLAQNAPRLQRRPVYMAAPYGYPPYPYYPYPYPYRMYYAR